MSNGNSLSLSDEEKARIVDLYKAGLGIQAIARQIPCTPRKVRYTLRTSERCMRCDWLLEANGETGRFYIDEKGKAGRLCQDCFEIVVLGRRLIDPIGYFELEPMRPPQRSADVPRGFFWIEMDKQG